MGTECKLVDDIGNRAGLSHDVAILVRQIAISHIDDGANTLDDVVKRTQKDIPGAKEADIWNSLGRRSLKESKNQRKKVNGQVSELQTEARLTAQIDDALNGILDQSKKGKVDTKKIEALRKKLRVLQRDLSKDTRDEAQKLRMTQKIEEVRELLRTDVIREDKKAGDKLRKDVQDVHDNLQDLLSQVRAKASIKTLQNRLDGKEDQITDKTKPKSSDELTALRQDRDSLRKEISIQESLERQILNLQAELNDKPTHKVRNGEPLISSPKIQELTNTVKEMKAQVSAKKKAAKDIKAEAQRIALWEKRLVDIKKGIKPRATPKREPSADVEGAKKAYREALRMLNTKTAIASLREQLRTEDWKSYEPTTTKKQKEISDELDMAIREKNALQKTIRDLIEQNRDRSIISKVTIEIGLAMRAILLSGELGFTGRQMVVWTLNPFTVAKSVKNITKAVIRGFSEAGAERLNMQLRADPRFLDAQRSKLIYREMDHDITGAEEYTRSWLIRKTPGLNQYIALNDRLMVTYMNLMAHDIYYSYTDTNPHATREQRKSMAHLVNVSSGRGTALGVESWAKTAVHLMLAPRFMISRLQAPFTAAKAFKEGDAGERMFVAKSWGGFMATGASLLLLASMIPGVEIEDDPESTDFMKIRWGNKRIDIWGGFLQPVQLFMKILFGVLSKADITESTRKGRPKDLKDEIGGFVGNRTSPLVNLVNIIATGKTFSGDKVPVIKDMFEMNAEGLLDDSLILGKELATPIIVQEVVEAYELEGIGGASLSFFLNQVGFGTSTYEIKSKKKSSKF